MAEGENLPAKSRLSEAESRVSEKEQHPKEERELIDTKNQEQRIAIAKNQGVIPALEALAEEIGRRAQTGQLRRELKQMKVAALIHNLTKIISAIKAQGPIVIVPGRAASEDKDASWFRANSMPNIADNWRGRIREKILNAEVVNQNGEKVDSKDEAKEGSPDGDGSQSGGDKSGQDKTGLAPQ